MASVHGGQIPRSGQPRHILVITYWSYPDALIQTYTLPYLRIMLRCLPAGSHIHLVTLETTEPVEWDHVDEPGISVHRYRYRSFGVRGVGMLIGLTWSLSSLIRRQGVDTLHAWCTPAGMVGYLLSLFTGKRLVLDSFEPHAEAMVENGTWDRDGLAFRVLFRFERLQARRAAAVIATTEGMGEYARETYGVDLPRMYVKPACVDLEQFSVARAKDPKIAQQLGLTDELVAVYAGKFGGIYLDQEVFDLLRVARDHWGPRFHVLILTGQSRRELMPFIDRAGLDESLFTILSVPHAEVPGYLGVGDFALNPVRPVPTKRYCTPIKDGEYWSLGLPVLITAGISDDSDIIAEHGIGVVLEGLTEQEYQKAILSMDQLLRAEPRSDLRERIHSVAEQYRNFHIAEHVYRGVYGEL